MIIPTLVKILQGYNAAQISPGLLANVVKKFKLAAVKQLTKGAYPVGELARRLKACATERVSSVIQ
jgi:hypothetical protein